MGWIATPNDHVVGVQGDQFGGSTGLEVDIQGFTGNQKASAHLQHSFLSFAKGFDNSQTLQSYCFVESALVVDIAAALFLDVSFWQPSSEDKVALNKVSSKARRRG